MDENSRIPLREYFEKIIELQHAANERALDLNTSNINRRLDALNELRASVEKDRSEFVKQDVFDLSVKEVKSRLDSTKEDLDIRLRGIETRQSSAESRSITWISAIGLFLLIMEIVLKFLIR